METAAGSKILSIVLAATLVISISLATPGIAQDRFYLIDLNSRTATELGSLGGRCYCCSAAQRSRAGDGICELTFIHHRTRWSGHDCP